jgi:hypothetical protein
MHFIYKWRKKSFLEPFLQYKRSIHQDRLGTDIGNAEKNEAFLFPQDSGSSMTATGMRIEGSPALAGILAGAKIAFWRHVIPKRIILPRQARDKHTGKS